MNFLTLLGKMVVLFAFVAVGLICQKLNILDAHASEKVNKLVLYICAPSLIIKSVFGAEVPYAVPQLLMLIGYGLGYNIISLLLALVLVRIIRPAREDRSTETFLLTYANCVFMGFPVISAVFGKEAILLASVCTLPYNFFLYIVGVMLLSGRGDMKQVVRKAVLNPSFFATLLSLVIFFSHVSVPAAVQDIFTYLGDMVVPLAMMLIGASLGTVSLREIFTDKRTYLVSLLRLIVMPLIIALIARLVVREPMFRNLIIVFAVMPSAAVSPIFAAEYGGEPLLASKSVFMSTLFSLITVPILLSFLLTVP